MTRQPMAHRRYLPEPRAARFAWRPFLVILALFVVVFVVPVALGWRG